MILLLGLRGKQLKVANLNAGSPKKIWDALKRYGVATQGEHVKTALLAQITRLNVADFDNSFEKLHLKLEDLSNQLQTMGYDISDQDKRTYLLCALQGSKKFETACDVIHGNGIDYGKTIEFLISREMCKFLDFPLQSQPSDTNVYSVDPPPCQGRYLSTVIAGQAS